MIRFRLLTLSVLLFAGQAFANGNVNVNINTFSVDSDRVAEVEVTGDSTHAFPDPYTAPEIADVDAAIDTALAALGYPPGTSATIQQTVSTGTDEIVVTDVSSTHNPIDDPTVVIGDPNDYSTWIAISNIDVQVEVEITTTSYEFFRVVVAIAPPCGDSIVQPGEQCDDGNTDDGDCCSSTCTFDPAGSPCDDGVTCTAFDTCDGAGTCDPGGPATTCVSSWTKATLLVKEKKPGKEKVIAKLIGGPALTQADFGSPVVGNTAYDICLFDDVDNLVVSLLVDRAADECAGKECWKAKKDTGWKYKDKDAASDGVTKMNLFGGLDGKTQVQVQAANNVKKNQVSLPTGIASALQATTSVRLQVRTSDAQCFDVTVDQIKKQEADFFKALRK